MITRQEKLKLLDYLERDLVLIDQRQWHYTATNQT